MQRQRDRVMQLFKDGHVNVLVATDVAARGLDVEHLSHVIQLRRAAGGGRLRASHRPHGPHRPRGRRDHAGRSARTAPDAEHRSVHQAAHRDRHRCRRQPICVCGGWTRHASRCAKRIATGGLEGFPHRRGGAGAGVRCARRRRSGGEDGARRFGASRAGAAPPQAAGERRGARAFAAPRARGTSGTRRAPRPCRASGARTERPAKRPGVWRAGQRQAVELTRLYIGAGRQAGVGARDLVGAITGETGLTSSAVGAIDVADRFSIVEVPEAHADQIIDALRATKLRGQKVDVLPRAMSASFRAMSASFCGPGPALHFVLRAAARRRPSGTSRHRPG